MSMIVYAKVDTNSSKIARAAAPAQVENIRLPLRTRIASHAPQERLPGRLEPLPSKIAFAKQALLMKKANAPTAYQASSAREAGNFKSVRQIRRVWPALPEQVRVVSALLVIFRLEAAVSHAGQEGTRETLVMNLAPSCVQQMLKAILVRRLRAIVFALKAIMQYFPSMANWIDVRVALLTQVWFAQAVLF